MQGKDKTLVSCAASVELRAPAKVNLGLRLVGRRADGYHLLESLFWPLSFTDELRLTPAERSSLEASWADDAPKPQPLPPADANLVTKAFLQVEGTWKVQLTKRIPMGAGLGGGSSDAGAVLRHFGVTGDAAEKLGADVPFFLDPRPTWVDGIGERRKPLSLAPGLVEQLYFLLVILPESIDTRAAFRAYREQGPAFSPSACFPVDDKVDFEGLRRYLAEARNDLIPAAELLCPRVATILAALRSQQSLYADMSGSGSTCFAIFADAETRKKTSQALATTFRINNCTLVFAETFNRDHHGNHRSEGFPG